MESSAPRVVTADIDEELVASARRHLSAAGLSRVEVVCGDGALGYPDETLAHRLIEQISVWDAAGRPSMDTLRIRACPAQSGHVPDAGEVVVEKRWTRLVLGWRQTGEGR